MKRGLWGARFGQPTPLRLAVVVGEGLGTYAYFLANCFNEAVSSKNPESFHESALLDELIRVMKGAHNALLNLEELDEKGARPHTSQLREISGRGKKALQ